MRRIFEKLDAREYTNMSRFRSDLVLNWVNVRLFFGFHASPAAHVTKLEQDLPLVQQLQIDADLAN